MSGFNRRYELIALASGLCVLLTLIPAGIASAAPAEDEYTIYSMPHSVSYGSDTVNLDKVDLVVEDGIDSDTELRFDDALSLQFLPAIV